LRQLFQEILEEKVNISRGRRNYRQIKQRDRSQFPIGRKKHPWLGVQKVKVSILCCADSCLMNSIGQRACHQTILCRPYQTPRPKFQSPDTGAQGDFSHDPPRLVEECATPNQAKRTSREKDRARKINLYPSEKTQ